MFTLDVDALDAQDMGGGLSVTFPISSATGAAREAVKISAKVSRLGVMDVFRRCRNLDIGCGIDILYPLSARARVF